MSNIGIKAKCPTKKCGHEESMVVKKPGYFTPSKVAFECSSCKDKYTLLIHRGKDKQVNVRVFRAER